MAIADFAIVAGKSCNRAGNNGWCWQRPLPQGNFILDYAFVDDNRGWAVGQGGTILATADGGVTWNAQPSGTTFDISQAVFPSATAGWLTSEFGELLRTADGGASWRRVSYGRNDFVLALGASDADTAWVTTTLGAGFVTRDGGSSWRQLEQAPGGTFRFAFASATDVWSLPPFIDPQPTLGHSLDGGTTWTTVTLPTIAAGFSGYSEDMLFVDPLHALVIGFESGFDPSDPTIFITRRTLQPHRRRRRLVAGGAAADQRRLLHLPPRRSDHGHRRQRQRRAAHPGQRRQLAGGADAARRPRTSPAFAPSARSASSSPTSFGKTWLSTDGGASWNLRNAGGVAQATLNSIWFFDSRDGLAIADDGSSVRTADGGKTWTAAESDTVAWYRLQFLGDGSVGWLISLRGTIARSIDKGRNWTMPSGASQRLAFRRHRLPFHRRAARLGGRALRQRPGHGVHHRRRRPQLAGRRRDAEHAGLQRDPLRRRDARRHGRPERGRDGHRRRRRDLGAALDRRLRPAVQRLLRRRHDRGRGRRRRRHRPLDRCRPELAAGRRARPRAR